MLPNPNPHPLPRTLTLPEGLKLQDHRLLSISSSDLEYNLTADLLHKPSFPHRFYFHYNGSSNSTRGRLKALPGQITCSLHMAYQKVTNWPPQIVLGKEFEGNQISFYGKIQKSTYDANLWI